MSFFFKMTRPLILFSVIGFIVAASEAVSTGSAGLSESPWMWSSPGERSDEIIDARVLEVDVLEPDSFVYQRKPRFIGQLKRKLCRVGLGVGKRSPICNEDENLSELKRVKRSAQFLQFEDRSDDVKREDGTSSRFLGNGLDGLLNPHISPSFGVHFGHPYGHGYGGGYNRGYDNPFSFNLGPISINPFGGLRVSLRDGRPLIRPTLDFVVTPNRNNYNNYNNYDNNYNNYYQRPPYGYPPYHNRHAREAKFPVSASSTPILHRTRSLKPSTPLKLSPSSLKVQNPLPLETVYHPKAHQVHFPINSQILYQENNQIRPNVPTAFHKHKHIEAFPYSGLGKSLSSSESVRDDRDDIYRKESR